MANGRWQNAQVFSIFHLPSAIQDAFFSILLDQECYNLTFTITLHHSSGRAGTQNPGHFCGLQSIYRGRGPKREVGVGVFWAAPGALGIVEKRPELFPSIRLPIAFLRPTEAVLGAIWKALSAAWSPADIRRWCPINRSPLIGLSDKLRRHTLT
jgi:hypothetical protein